MLKFFLIIAYGKKTKYRGGVSIKKIVFINFYGYIERNAQT